MNRRTLLQLIALNAAALPQALRAEAAKPIPPFRRLLLIELNGGNDGLNTVVPFRDPRYYALRPNIALEKSTLLPMNGTLAFHPAMRGMKRLYDAGELAVVQGVGYPRPNRSHFRSIDIWDTASSSDEYFDEGWIHTLDALNASRIKGVVLGGELGPLEGTDSGIIKVNRLEAFLNQSKSIASRITYTNDNPALLHILNTEAEISRSAAELKTYLARVKKPPFAYDATPFGRQLEIATRIIDSRLPVPVLKIKLGPFDTHFNQLPQHARLLKELSDGLFTLRRNLLQSAQWKNTLVMTYSEFGRRAAENASRGTDHGTAAPHFFAGGAVRGGVYGTMPSLGDLDANGDLKFTTDFRDLYHTVQQEWFHAASERLEPFKVLPIISAK